MGKRLGAEFFGTFWLVFGGCGSAAGGQVYHPRTEHVNIGVGLVGVALAFGLTVLTMAYAIGHISGCHLNPAVSVGFLVGGRFKATELIPYIIVQVLGGLAGAAVLYLIASGREGFSLRDGFAQRLRRPLTRWLLPCRRVPGRGVLTIRSSSSFSGSPTASHLRHRPADYRAGPDTNPPGRHSGDQPVCQPRASTGPALLVGGTPLVQLWLFWVRLFTGRNCRCSLPRTGRKDGPPIRSGQQAGCRRAARPGYPADLGCPADHQAGPV